MMIIKTTLNPLESSPRYYDYTYVKPSLHPCIVISYRSKFTPFPFTIFFPIGLLIYLKHNANSLKAIDQDIEIALSAKFF